MINEIAVICWKVGHELIYEYGSISYNSLCRILRNALSYRHRMTALTAISFLDDSET